MAFEDVEIISHAAADTDEWHNTRSTGIGGSDVSAICGVNKYKSPFQLWAEKTGRYHEEVDNEAIKWGNRLEPVVAEAFAEETGLIVLEWPVTLRSRTYPWMLANMDRLYGGHSEKAGFVSRWTGEVPPTDVEGILEIKTSGIATHGTAHLWDDEQIPDSYLLQGYHYGIVTGIHRVTFAGLLGGQGLVTREIEWDDQFAADIIEAERLFWELVQSDTPPPTDGSESTETVLKELYPKHTPDHGIEGGHALDILWGAYDLAKEEAKHAVEAKKRLRAEILQMIGSAEFGMVDGVPILSFKASRDVEYFDDKTFKKEMPDVYAKYVKKRPGPRTLRAIKN